MKPNMTKRILKHVTSLLLAAALAVLFTRGMMYLSSQFDQDFAQDFVTRLGAFGIYLCLMIIDTVPTPGGALSVLSIAVQGGVSALVLTILALLASYSVATVAFLLGRRLGIPKRWLAKIEDKYGEGLKKVRDNDVYGFIFLASLPIPMSIAAWTGASFGFSPRALMIGTLARVPKVLIYLFASFSSVTFF